MPYEPDTGWINGDHLAVVNSRFGKSTQRLQAGAHIEVDDGREGIESAVPSAQIQAPRPFDRRSPSTSLSQ